MKESIFHPFHPHEFGEFEALDDTTKKKLEHLFSRVAEHAFRRGFSHGKASMKRKQPTVDYMKLRYETPLDISPNIELDENGKWHTENSISSIERLHMEFSELYNNKII